MPTSDCIIEKLFVWDNKEGSLLVGEATSPTRHLCVRMASMMDSPTRATLARR